MPRYALVIGIAEYKNPLQRLPKTTTDAEAVVQVLKKYGDFQQVIRLPERWNQEKQGYEIAAKAVTGKELGEALRKFLMEQAVGEDALIYFTGHGFKISDNLGQEKGYLATSDCIIQTDGNRIVEIQNGIALDSFNELIRASNLRSLVLLLDCCHSGYFLERQSVEQSLTAISSRRDYYLITACRDFEEAIAFDFEQHDVFTGALIEGLSVENAGEDGQISGDRLFDYISSTLKHSKQEPIRMGWGRSITLVTYPKEDITKEEITFNTENPYRGLYPFESEQEKYFCGREQAIRALLDRLSSNRFLSVIGPSGCGKSSLVKAGLLPHLERDRLPGSSQWGIETFTPGKHPLGKLIEILDRQHRQNQPFVLFIDQMEEVFTLCEDDAERQAFIRLMADEATKSERITRVIVAIRTDFLDRCAAYPEVANLINLTQPTTYMVTPLSRPELEEAIEEPASLHGVKFERGLISQIADDVHDRPGALPLLQYALKELWRVCIEKPDSPEPCLTGKGYEEIGGVTGALENRANLLYQSFSSPDQLFVRQMFMELVQLGEETKVTRRRATRERLEANADSIDQLRRVVGLLANQRLIVTDEDTVEVAHEALLTEWTLLRGWIEENRENIRLDRLLEAECGEWQVQFNKSDNALLTGAKLAIILEWKEKIQPKLTVEEAEFLRKSLARRDREIKEELERERQRTRFAIGVGVLAASTLAFGLLATVIEGKKRESDAIAIGALISKSQDNFEKHQQLEALIASIQALDGMIKINNKDNKYLETLQNIIYKVQERNRLEGHTKIVNGVSYSPDGKIIISVSEDKNIIIWNANGKKIKVITGHKKPIYGINFNYFNNKQLMFASASFDKTVMLWSKEGNRLTSPLIGHQDIVFNVSFSPDNHTLASISQDGTIKLWDIKTGKIRKTIKDKKWNTKENTTAYSIDINPKNKLMIASSGYLDGRLNIWNLASSEQPQALYMMGHNNNITITKVKFNYNGNILALADSDGNIILWGVDKSKIIGKIKAHDEVIYSLAFSPNDQLIATGSQDKTVKIWNVKQIEKFWNSNEKSLIEPVDILQGHAGAINDLQFNPKYGTMLATASDDKTIRIWQIRRSNFNKGSPIQINRMLEDSCDLVGEYIDNKKNKYQNISSICSN